MTTLPAPNPTLITELRQLIDAARQRATLAVNAELTMFYWQVDDRIHRDILGNQHAGYGEAIVSTLSRQLTADYGRGFSAKNLGHMIRFQMGKSLCTAETIDRRLRTWLEYTPTADTAIVNTLCAELELVTFEQARQRLQNHKDDT